jgi:hypothetical protein
LLRYQVVSNLQIGAVEILPEQAFGVAVNEPGSYEAQGSRILPRDGSGRTFEPHREQE